MQMKDVNRRLRRWRWSTGEGAVDSEFVYKVKIIDSVNEGCYSMTVITCFILKGYTLSDRQYVLNNRQENHIGLYVRDRRLWSLGLRLSIGKQRVKGIVD